MSDEEITREEFERLVAGVLDSLPEAFAEKLDNVNVTVEDWPSPEDIRASHLQPGMTLFGLYRGIPRTDRTHYHAALPDKIVIFMGPILTQYGQDGQILGSQIRQTVLHEIGHHFGMSEAEIRAAQSDG